MAEWATEEHVQDLLMGRLRRAGYEIVRFANTSTKEHGVDVVAAREGETIVFEVKGWPSKIYAAPRRAGETKKTSPTNQAGHWYSQAILAAMKLRTAQLSWRSAIALPDYPRYRRLYAKTSESLHASQIDVVFISEDGTVEAGTPPSDLEASMHVTPSARW